MSYPAQLGFRMPAEWARHQRTFMEWPVREALWPEPFEDVLPAYAAIVRTIAGFEPVTVLARPELVQQAVKMCGPKVDVLAMEHNDSWIRDNGPTFVISDKGELAGINWIFNAWGDKYACEKDNLVAPRLLEAFGVKRFDAPVVMEGGSIHVDGEGTILTTEECLLHTNRNPKLKREEIEQAVKNHVNAEKIVWMKRGWHGDDTDGHVDNIACFARPGVILAQVCSDPDDPNYEISRENLETLHNATDAKGRNFEIITIEQPRATYYEDVRLTLSYLNFYFVNGGIVVPVFGEEHEAADKAAIEVLQKTFPDRKIAPVNGILVARGGGNVHCLTQQMPEAIRD
jgi:agmatine deiminase